MKKGKYTKVTLLTILFVILILLLSPTVLSGAFNLHIIPPTTPIQPGIEMREIDGVHQLIPSAIDNLLPPLWMSQYSEIMVTEKPEWASVAFPDSHLITPPDGIKYNLTGYVAVSEDAPAYEFGTVQLQITTGKFMRRIFPPWFPFCDEFNLDQTFQVRAAYFPGMEIEDVPIITLPTNTSEEILINITNTGNARSILQFSVASDEIPVGWSLQAPPSIYLNRNEMEDVEITINTPYTNEEIDEWAYIPLSIHQRSVVEPLGPSYNITVPITVHCVSP